MPIRVLIVDDHQIVRDGLKSMLAKQLDIEVVGESENGRDGIAQARVLKPDVVIMDIGMRELNGIQATKQLIEEQPEVKVIALSMHSEQRYVSEMLAMGAHGYLLKDSAFEDLARAIRDVMNGRRFLSSRVANIVLDDYLHRIGGGDNDAPNAIRALSSRENEVLQLIAEGLSTKEIASKLHLSVKTVETYRRQMMEKLGIYNIAGLIKFAVREGIASLD